jgi:hypothetical protein
VTQLVLPLHECAAERLQDAVEFLADPAVAKATTDPAAIESAAEPACSSAALTETFCLCVRV